MTSTTKPQKEKMPYTPRLVPRPTAASAARAARNATIRNLSSASGQKLSPSRVASSSPSTKSKSFSQRSSLNQKTDLKIDDKTVSLENDTEFVMLTSTIEAGELDENSQDIENTYIIDLENSEKEEKKDDNSGASHLEEINEDDVFEIKHEDPVVSINTDSPRTYRPTDRNHSLPPTPASSRPATPNLSVSRPQTPGPPSRPTTPGGARPASRPATPHRLAKPLTPSKPRGGSLPQNKQDTDDIKTTFLEKQRQFTNMKKELDLKQQAVLEVFDSLRGLCEHMNRDDISGSGEGLLQELVLFHVADWTTEEISQLCREAVAPSESEKAIDMINTAMPIDERVLAEIDEIVSNVPSQFADLCLQAFTARQELIDWIKGLIDRNVFTEETGCGECMERIALYNAQGLELCEALKDVKCRANDAVDTVTQFFRRVCRERSALTKVGEALVREIAKLRQDMNNRSTVVEIKPDDEVSKTLEETRRELEEEKAARTATKDKLATTESQLRQTRLRINKMDRQLREAEASIASLTSTVKSLEDQSRQKEVQLEARARKLKESLKTGEMTSGQLAHQRDALQNEILELKQKIDTLTTQHTTVTQDFNKQIRSLKNAYEEQTRKMKEEIEHKEAAQSALSDSRNMINELNNKITEYENNKPNPDLPTEREMDLWAELQATKDTLRITEDEITACKREKIRFLETLTKIAESENKVGMQQKLAAELLSKEEIMGNMQIQIRDLTKSIKVNEQKVIQYEQYVRDLQANNRHTGNICPDSPDGVSYQDLQQEIMELKLNLLESEHRNDEMTEVLAQKNQLLEQQDKTSRTQARVLKAREELISLLRNKETEQSKELTSLQQDLEHRMKVVDEVNKQIAAKAEEIQELFGTLENKQQQIQRLEKIVFALEEQQRRAQAQRIRHEEKIAALEHELAAGGNRRDRKFLFF